jgi:hypothetical protein
LETTDIYHQERESLRERIFKITDAYGAAVLEMDVFRFQYRYNNVYQTWCDALSRSPAQVQEHHAIPFLPISFFRTHQVQTGPVREGATVFGSSGTTGADRSKHFVPDLALYRKSAKMTFEKCFGAPSELVIIALLPSYLERTDSSLVYMCKMLIEDSGTPESGFFLNQYDELLHLLETLAIQNRQVCLIGVSFALLDFAGYRPPAWPGLKVVETGGMKGRGKELLREELHSLIRKTWPVPFIYSEYGMTELLSQAYSGQDGFFQAPPWMRIQLRDLYDPLSQVETGALGAINVVDLANIDSCAFIATDDLGRGAVDGRFTVNGRFDHSLPRGCNLLLNG